jgi:hypothetical protein
MITASNDNNVKIHRLSNGVLIGQFGQAETWSLHNMSKYENRKPRYVRDWYLRLKRKMKEFKKKEEEEA